ncbi:heterodisulfide reductase-related iron-sulfur binding cluster [Marinobacterium arenosum]|uniref:heterodisulfide reductase-related iron-sulfur binding cluster n=1 Tax=Marinobacterium arenosum TaxID=2862496 RepID=UPI001C97907D|nr:heterodisulfide reductase-related iron-sulfur binding cluster [Marinobacterium arenosum]MBY4677348.1 Fe-S oxidoreductase [Marinobacterium arenosum]
MSSDKKNREGGLDAPTRHPLDWQNEQFYDRQSLDAELERVFDICHGCRRCVSLCDTFPTLFELVDNSATLEIDGVAKADYQQVIDQCYLCDLCYMTKCPYVPPHEWNVDFPHLMLRGKAAHFKEQGASLRDRLLTSTDAVARMATIPLLDITVNALNRNKPARKALEKTLGVAADAPLPEYHRDSLHKRGRHLFTPVDVQPGERTRGRVALFATCYGNYNSPQIGEDLIRVFQHNGIEMRLADKQRCCGMPKLELGDLDSVKRARDANIPRLAALVDEGYDLTAPMPSCVLMFKRELPLMFPGDAEVAKVAAAFFDPFEYLWLRHKDGLLMTDFQQGLGNISYHVACHLRVQNVGLKARDLLQLVPDTRVEAIERCSGHDGTYGVRSETRTRSVKIARLVVRKIDQQQADHLASDCPMAANHLASLAEGKRPPMHPITLLRQAYGL